MIGSLIFGISIFRISDSMYYSTFDDLMEILEGLSTLDPHNKSTTKRIFFLGSMAISWDSTKQKIVPLSLCG